MNSSDFKQGLISDLDPTNKFPHFRFNPRPPEKNTLIFLISDLNPTETYSSDSKVNPNKSKQILLISNWKPDKQIFLIPTYTQQNVNPNKNKQIILNFRLKPNEQIRLI